MASLAVQLGLSVVVAAAIYLALSVFGEAAIATLFYAYVIATIAAAILNFPLGRHFQMTASDPYLPSLFREIRKAQDKSALTRAREFIADALIRVSRTILWPAVQLKGFLLGFTHARATGSPQLNLAYLSGRLQLDGLDVQCALLTLLINAAIAIAHFRHGANSIYAECILFITIAAIGLRHLEYLITPGGLHQRLRSGSGDPPINFGLVTVADFLALVFGYLALRRWADPSPPDWAAIRSTVESLIGSFTLAKDLWVNPAEWRTLLAPSVQTASSLSGLLVMTALVKGIVKYKEFERQDEDYVNQARAYLVVGEFREGLRCVNRAKPSAPQLMTKAALELGAPHHAAEAAQLAQKAQAERKRDSVDEMAATWSPVLMIAPLPKASVVALLRELINLKAGDAVLSHVAYLMAGTNKAPPQELLDAVSPEHADKLPLMRAALLALLDRAGEARDLLAAAPPQRDIDDLMRRIALFDVGLIAEAPDTRAKTEEFARMWLAEHGTRLEHLADRIKTDLEKSLILFRLMRPLALARTLANVAQDFFEKLRQRLRDDLEHNPEFDAMLNLELQELPKLTSALKKQMLAAPR